MDDVKIFAIAFCFVIATSAGCVGVVNHQDNEAINSLVASGADPQDAQCAIKNSGSNNEVCAIRAATKNK